MRRPSPAGLGSVALHLGVAALAFLSWPERSPEDPKPLVSSVPVSIVSETEVAAAAADNPLATRREDGGPVYVVSVSGPKMYEVGKGRTWATRTGANAQLYQVITVSPQALKFEARTVTGQLFDAFEITRARNGRRRFIDRKPELPGTY